MTRVWIVKAPHLSDEGPSAFQKIIVILQVISSILLITIGTHLFVPEALFDTQTFQWILASSPDFKLYSIGLGVAGIPAAYFWLRRIKWGFFPALIIHFIGMLLIAEVGSYVGAFLCLLTMVIILLHGR
ncbi:MAG: membrane protein of unknown function [Candidatus Thorarchaeota archaeon]|nr:MAG: membrane protein of unknown function [Candidatus Thorarchaeota archaeon]